MHQWGKFFVEGGKKIGRSFTIVEDGVQRSAMEKAGFVDLEEKNFKVSCPFRENSTCDSLRRVGSDWRLAEGF